VILAKSATAREREREGGREVKDNRREGREGGREGREGGREGCGRYLREELHGRLRGTSLLPQYLITAMFTGALLVTCHTDPLVLSIITHTEKEREKEKEGEKEEEEEE